MNRTKRTNIQSRFTLYIAVGMSAFLVEYFAFILLNAMGQVLITSQTLSFVGGLIVSFTGNRKLTFGGKNIDYALSGASQMWRYLLLAVINLVLSNVMIHVLVDDMGIGALVAKVLVMASVVAWNFVIFNKIIFRANRM